MTSQTTDQSRISQQLIKHKSSYKKAHGIIRTKAQVSSFYKQRLKIMMRLLYTT